MKVRSWDKLTWSGDFLIGVLTLTGDFTLLGGRVTLFGDGEGGFTIFSGVLFFSGLSTDVSLFNFSDNFVDRLLLVDAADSSILAWKNSHRLHLRIISFPCIVTKIIDVFYYGVTPPPLLRDCSKMCSPKMGYLQYLNYMHRLGKHWSGMRGDGLSWGWSLQRGTTVPKHPVNHVIEQFHRLYAVIKIINTETGFCCYACHSHLSWSMFVYLGRPPLN